MMINKKVAAVVAITIVTSIAGCGKKSAAVRRPDSVQEAADASDISTLYMDGVWKQPETPLVSDHVKDELKNAEQSSNTSYIPVVLIGTRKDEGAKYALLCRARTQDTVSDSEESAETWTVITLYVGKDGSPRITGVLDSGTPTNVSQDNNITGGWGMADSPVMTAEEKSTFEKAVKSSKRKEELNPVAILTEQVVAGENYCYFGTTDNGAYVFVYIYEDLNRSAKITDVVNFRFG